MTDKYLKKQQRDLEKERKLWSRQSRRRRRGARLWLAGAAGAAGGRWRVRRAHSAALSAGPWAARSG